MLLLDKPNEKLSRISNVKFNLHSDNFWSSVSSVRADIGVLLVWEEVTSHGAAFWVSVSLPQFLLLVCRFITSICSFFCQINETKVQNKIYFDKSFKCWFVCEWKSCWCKYSWPPSEQSGGCSYSKEVGRVRAAVTFDSWGQWMFYFPHLLHSWSCLQSRPDLLTITRFLTVS